MASPIGSLTVELNASLAKFQTDLNRATASVEASATRMQKAFRGVIGGFVGGFVAGLSVRAFAQFVSGAIDAADRLNDLRQTTGLTVTTLGGLQLAAEQTGSNLDGVAKGIQRLNQQIGAARGGNEKAIETFRGLGLSLREITELADDEILFRISDRFSEWADGANKSAQSAGLFGQRLGGEMIPFLNQGGAALRENIEYFRRYGAINDEVAASADKFNDTLSKIALLNRAFATHIASELLPVLDSLAERFVDASEKGESFRQTAETIGAVIRGLAAGGVLVAGVFEGVGKSLGVAAAQMAQVMQGNFAIARQMGEEFEKENAERVKRMQATLAAILNPSATGAPGPGRGGQRQAPPPVDTGAQDQLAKRLLDGQIRALEASIRDEADILKLRERFLQDYFRDDLISFDDYFRARRAALDENLAKELAAYDEQIRLLREAQSKANTPADRADLENQIGEALRKRSKAERDAAVESIQLSRDQDREMKRFRDTIEQVAIRLEEMTGNTAVAAIAWFDVQNDALRERIELERQSSDEGVRRQAEIAASALAGLRERVVAQATLNELQERFGQSLQGLAIDVERINLARNAGALTELEALQRISDANRGVIEQLREWESQMAAVVATTNDPAMILALEQVRVQIEQLSQETDLVGDKFRGIFRDSFTDAFASVIDGSKSAKNALLDFAKSVEQMISRIAAQNIAEALFGGQKGGGGGLFGGFIGDFFKSLFGGGFANGGFPPVGKWSLVGERGPELIRPLTPTQVIPNHAIGGSGRDLVVTNNFYVSGPTDRHSQSQIAVQAGLGMRRALARDA